MLWPYLTSPYLTYLWRIMLWQGFSDARSYLTIPWQGFPEAFPIRSPADLTDGDPTTDQEMCLQPYIAKEPEL